ncbi:MAG: N-acetyl-gamma-glutamyl-phosphate reductase [Eubacteriales bacterium]|jgi:N-acetyl-gamma-glutamyl-phosphate reductase
MIKAGVIGATGYAGAEVYRLLLSHPQVESITVASVSYEGQDIASIFQNFYQRGDSVLLSPEEVIDQSDVIFAGVPHGAAEGYAKLAYDQGKKFIDLGADFRLEDEAVYTKWYGCEYHHKQLHEQAVYGLPEMNRERIRKASIIGNPGCYPTSIALGLMPAMKQGLVDVRGMVIDSKSGVSGSGRGLSQTTHFPDCNEAFSPYKIGAHRHTPEIEQTLSQLCGQPVKVTFTPHLLPLNRGIVSTIYADFAPGVTLEQVRDAYEQAYREETFVRVLPAGQVANLKWVRMSNYCDISLHEDAHTGKLIVVSTIDNTVKGTAGQAIQNMNLMFGFGETEGLMAPPPAF